MRLLVTDVRRSDREATVDGVYGPADPRGVVAREEQRHLGNLGNLAQATHRVVCGGPIQQVAATAPSLQRGSALVVRPAHELCHHRPWNDAFTRMPYGP